MTPSAAVLCNDVVLSNIVARQAIHEEYGGVVPELASSAPTEYCSSGRCCYKKAIGITKNDLNCIAFYTRSRIDGFAF